MRITKKPPKEWELFIDAMIDLLSGLRIKRTKKTYAKLEYYGSLKEIKKACNKMISVCEDLEEKQRKLDEARVKETGRRHRNGLSTEGGRKEVLDRNSLYRDWGRGRIVEE